MGHLKQLCEPLAAHEGTGGGAVDVGEEAIKTQEFRREQKKDETSYSFTEKEKNVSTKKHIL